MRALWAGFPALACNAVDAFAAGPVAFAPGKRAGEPSDDLMRPLLSEDRMTTQQWLGLLLSGLFFGFIWFAFRQGMKVKPDPKRNRQTGAPGTDVGGFGLL